MLETAKAEATGLRGREAALTTVALVAALVPAAVAMGLLAPALPWQLLAAGLGALALAPWLLGDPFRLVVFWVAASPVLSLFIAYSPGPGRPDLTFDRLMALLLGGWVALRLALGRQGRVALGAVDAILVAFLGAQLLSTLRTEAFTPPQAWSTYVNVFVLPLLAFWLVRQTLAHPRKVESLVLGLALLGWAFGAMGTYEHLFATRVFPQVQAEWDDVPGGRAYGPLGNPAIFGAVLAGAIPAMVHRLRRSRTLLGLGFWGVGLLLAFVGAYFTYTRSVWLSVAAALAVYALGQRRLGRFLVAGAVVGAFLLLLVGSGLVEDPAGASRAGNEENVVGRWELMVAGWRAFLERPLTGWGFGNLNLYQHRFFEARGLLPSDFALRIVSHNTFLSLLAEGGVVVFALFAAALLLLFVPAVRALWRHAAPVSPEGAALAVLGGVAVGYVITALIVDVVYFPYFNLLFWTAAGALERTARLVEARVRAAHTRGERHRLAPQPGPVT